MILSLEISEEDKKKRRAYQKSHKNYPKMAKKLKFDKILKEDEKDGKK